jgi:hypothetical protein
VFLGFIGCGVLLLFLQAINAIVDTYLRFANSAMAASEYFIFGSESKLPLKTIITRHFHAFVFRGRVPAVRKADVPEPRCKCSFFTKFSDGGIFSKIIIRSIGLRACWALSL